MAKPRVFIENNQILTEDGLGGKRPLTDKELMDVRVDIPENLREQWNSILATTKQKAAANEEARKAKYVRTGKTGPGTAPEAPLNEMGTTGWERFTVKNLVDNPAVAKKYLQMHGYDVAEYGDGFNFAVRKGPGQPWRMLDPRGLADTGYDLLDLTADAASATAVVAGLAAGGPVGGFAGGLGAEAARQIAGKAAGVPQDLNPNKMMWQGAAGFAIPTTGKLAEGPGAALAEKTGAGLLKLSSKIIGSEPEITLKRAMIKGFGSQPSTVEAARLIRSQLARFTEDITPARQEADAIINDLTGKGITVDLSPMIDRMRAMTLGAKGEVKSVESGLAGIEEPAVHSLAERVFKRTKATLAAGGHDETSVPIDLAEKIKRSIQRAATRARAYEDVELTPPTRSMLKEFGYIGRKQVALAADSSGVVSPNTGKNYSGNMADLDKVMRIVTAMEESFNSGTTETKKMLAAQRAVKALHGESGTEYLDHLHNFDKLAGTNLAETAYKASVGKAFGQAGEIGVIPRFTPMGNVLMVGGGGASLASSNPSAAIAGLAAASPMVNMAAVKTGLGAVKLGKAVANLSGTLPVKLTAQAALEEALNRTVQ